MEKEIRVSSSLLACDFTNIDKEVKRAINSKVDWLHLDVMDGVFVNNISFGLPVIEKLKDYPIFKDVHLMIVNPEKYVERFIEAGADLITFHIETIKYKKDVKALIDLIHSYNVAAGISLNPDTPLDKVTPFLKDLDLVLVMSVNPGFGGQKFIPSSLEKVSSLRRIIDEKEYECLIEVDGGVNKETSKLLKEAGVDVLVAGSYLFRCDNMKERVKILKK